MPVVPIASAPSFASVSEMETLLRRTFSPPETAAANLILAGVTGAIQRAARQQIQLVTDDTVELRGVWNQDLKLPQRPVLDVSAVTLRDPAGISLALISTRDYVWNRFGDLQRIGFIARIPRPIEGYWGGPAATVTVTYTHGFATIPDDIQAICLNAAARAFYAPESSIATDGSGGFTAGRTTVGYLTADEQKELKRVYGRAAR